MSRLQTLFAVLLIFVAAHRAYLVVQPAYFVPNILEEMRGIVVFLADAALIPLLIVTLIRLVVDPAYRRDLLRTTLIVIETIGMWGLFALCLWMALAPLWALHPNIARFGALQYTGELLTALIVAQMVGAGKGTLLAGAFLTGTALHSLLAIAQFLHGAPLGLPLLAESPLILSDPYRPFGWTINPNNLAGSLLPGVFLALLLWRDPRPRARLLIGVGGVLTVGGVLASGSRAALIGLIVGMALIALRARVRPMWRWRYALLIGLIGGWGIIAFAGSLGERLALTEREFYLEDSLPVLAAHPLSGVGVHHLMLHIYLNNPANTLLLLPVHNAYLMMWTEIGLIGVLLFAVSYFRLIRRLWQRDLLPLGSALSAVAVVMLFDFYFWGDHRSRLLLFIVIGLAWGVWTVSTLADAPAAEINPPPKNLRNTDDKIVIMNEK